LVLPLGNVLRRRDGARLPERSPRARPANGETEPARMDARGILGSTTMRRQSLVAMVLAVMLLIPAATAYAEDQEVFVHVLPADTLALSVDQTLEFGGVEPGQTAHYDFWLNVVNTTAFGFTITVSGGDLQSFEWDGCDENGCYGVNYTGEATIPSTSLVVTGGDLDWWDGQDNVVSPESVAVTQADQTIISATEAAHGEFGFDNPMTSMDLTIPGDATPLLQYHTVLVYTINGPTP
jgi:hypothetical protein